MKILMVEDSELLGKSMKRGLEEHGYTVDWTRDAEEGLYAASTADHDILLVDRLLPKMAGTQLISRLRASNIHTPALMISARGALDDRISGLDDGADDYLPKPFEMAELLARLRALHRRSQGRGSNALRVGNLSIDAVRHVVEIGGEPVELTPKEVDLLAALASRQDRVVARAELVSLLYELDHEPESNSLDVLLARLRKKIAAADVEIATIRGKGFVFRAAPPSP